MDFEKLWSYLCSLWGMGYEGGPIEPFGGWGEPIPLPNFTYSPCHHILESYTADRLCMFV